jgi:hypothetical protein
MPRKRKLPPSSRHHQSWCAIFYGRPCDCDDDLPPNRRRHRPLVPGGVTDRDRREREVEDA